VPEVPEFRFADSPPDRPGAFSIRLPRKLEGTSELMRAYAEHARFPGWFGHNWDALYDSLKSFNDVEQRYIDIIHDDMPLLSPREFAIYIDTLTDVCKFWASRSDHKLTVAFPASERDRILDHLRTIA